MHLSGRKSAFMMITCYLDEQDYSALTDPKRESVEQRQLRDDLLKLARSGSVTFVFSAAAISEAVALTPDAAVFAELRAELLSELCGSNALVSFDKLIRMEIKALADQSTDALTVLDGRGRWFPDIPADSRPDTPWAGMQKKIEEEIGVAGLSRQQRRAAARNFVKNGKPRKAFKERLDQQDYRALTEELMNKYPMRPEYADVMARYALGRASGREFDEALMSSLVDPRWMMKWFASEHALSAPVAELVRRPGRELGQAMRQLVNASNQWTITLLSAGTGKNPTGKNGEIAKSWAAMVNRQLVNVAKSIGDVNKLTLGDVTAEDVDKYCPGLSAAIRSLYSSVWDSVNGAKKEQPIDSQAVDAMHALYAPYVTVFRADRFMTPHIQKQVKRHGTNVVSLLAELPDALKSLLDTAE